VTENSSIEDVHQINCFSSLKTEAGSATERSCFIQKIKLWTDPQKIFQRFIYHRQSCIVSDVGNFRTQYLGNMMITI